MTVINNNNQIIEDYNRKNKIFIRELMNKDTFMLDWYAGAIVPKHHPRYYDGRIEVNIRRSFNNYYGNINFEKDEYQVSDDIVNKLYSYVENNIEKLIKLALNQTTEMYEFGGIDSLRIKYKSIYLTISGINAISKEEKDEIVNIKNDIKNLICINKITNSSFNDENIPNDKIEVVVNEIAGTDDTGKNNLLSKLIRKIINLPENNETTIAQLMMLKNEEVAMLDPLTQGEIFNLLMKVCDRLNIKIEENHSEFGGLGYHYKFKKISSTNETNNENIINELVDAIDRLPKGTEISLSSILGDKFRNYETSELFEINKKVLSACKEKGIILNFDKYKDQVVGLPFNIPFIKE